MFHLSISIKKRSLEDISNVRIEGKENSIVHPIKKLSFEDPGQMLLYR